MDHLTRLLIAARDGDRRALERFIAETQADVWRVCRYLGDFDAADDLATMKHDHGATPFQRPVSAALMQSAVVPNHA